MARRFSTTPIIVLLAALSARPQQRASAQEAGRRRIVPLNKFSFDQRFEMVSGDPAMPHTHPEDGNIVVVKGSSALGMGDRFNRAGTRRYAHHYWVEEPNGERSWAQREELTSSR